MSDSSARPRVVIVGAGFGGLSAARELRKAPVDVLVVDRNNYHGFWPLLYQVATGILETQEIAYPVRSLLRKQRNADFRLADVAHIDHDARQIVSATGERVDYDYLVLAGGSTTNFFGNDALASHTFALKNVEEADQLRNHVLSAVEAASRAEDPAERDALLTFVIVGAGPTGVELAGQLSDLLRRTLQREFPSLDLSSSRVLLVSAGDGVLESFPERLSSYAAARLEKLGVELCLGTTVASVEHGIVRLGDGTNVAATTVVWAAGVRAADLAGVVDAERGPAGTVRVTRELQLANRPEVFVVGDMASLDDPYPMVAQVAMQQGRLAAKNIVAHLRGRKLGSFRYHDKGQMAIIGRRAAIVDGFGVKLRGITAWAAWLGLHILYLRGFRNRLIVMFDWVAAYVSPTRGAGIITRADAHQRVEALRAPRIEQRRAA